MNHLMLEEIIRNALLEDLQQGDLTTEAIFKKEDMMVRGTFIAKAPGVLAGFPAVAEVFRQVDPKVSCTCLRPDGDMVSPGNKIGEVTGSVRSILAGERIALNFWQRLSGIASQTARLVLLVTGYQVRITDTRKTTPGLRLLEKYAVRQGGGYNHRYSLADAVLIKDNHIAGCGSVTEAINRARKNIPHTATIEVETENESQVREALAAGADIIMLDNMTPAQMTEMVQLIRSHSVKVLIEASGNIDESNVREVAATGVDIISVGYITHSVKALDISLRIEPVE